MFPTILTLVLVWLACWQGPDIFDDYVEGRQIRKSREAADAAVGAAGLDICSSCGDPVFTDDVDAPEVLWPPAIVHQRDAAGQPVEMQLSYAARVVHGIHARLMDKGFDQGTALMLLMGSKVPEGLRSEAPELDEVLASDDLLRWLAH